MAAKHKSLPDQSELLRRMSYDPITGSLTWKKRPVSDFSSERDAKIWNTKYGGKSAGCKAWNKYGNPSHEVVVFNYVQYLAHRLIWVIVNGSLSEGLLIDHKDRNPFNNSILNLREATHGQNAQNQSIRTDNSSGYRGVAFNALRNKWMAYINHNGKRKYLGTHNTRWGAYAAYREAAVVHGEFSNLGSRPIVQ